MPIYKVTTEGDCEGRSTKLLGYVEADSPQHAMLHMKNAGKNECYQYLVEEVIDDLIVQATAPHLLSHLQVKDFRSEKWGHYGVVKTNTRVQKEKEEMVAEALRQVGLTVEDVIKFGGKSNA